MTSLRKRQSGFTIVELLIVIIIIGILATLVIVQFTNQQKKARDTQRKTDIGAIQTHLEAYYAEEGEYPADADAVRAIQGLKTDAVTGPREGTLQNSAASGDNYGYVLDANGDYTLTAILEDGGGTQVYSKSSENN